MFSEHIKPEDVMDFVYDSMLSVLMRMVELGFPPNLTPPHTASVYVVIDPEDPNRLGIGRSEPFLLSSHNKSDWSVIGLHNLDCSADEYHIPIGCFFGTVMSEDELSSLVLEKDTKPKSEAAYFVGILICPHGSEALGYYAKLDNLKNPSPFTKNPLTSDIFNFLKVHYTRIEDSDETIH